MPPLRLQPRPTHPRPLTIIPLQCCIRGPFKLLAPISNMPRMLACAPLSARKDLPEIATYLVGWPEIIARMMTWNTTAIKTLSVGVARHEVNCALQFCTSHIIGPLKHHSCMPFTLCLRSMVEVLGSHVHAHTFIYARILAYALARSRTHAHKCTHLHTRTRTHGTRKCAHARAHTHTHTHTCARRKCPNTRTARPIHVLITLPAPAFSITFHVLRMLRYVCMSTSLVLFQVLHWPRTSR